jgi:O-antigen/teichoic acid export membrane protein
MQTHLAAISLLFLMVLLRNFNLNPLRYKKTKAILMPSLWRSVSGSLLLSACFNFALFQMDTLLVGALIGTAQAGIYNVACGLVRVMIIIPLAVATAISPIAASTYAKGSTLELQYLLSISLTITSISSVLIATFLLLTGNWLLNIVGIEYIEGYTALCILIVAHTGNALAIPLLSLLNMTDHHAHVFRILGCASALNFVLDVALIPRYGMKGAAVAVAITLLSVSLASAIVVRVSLKLFLKPIFMLWYNSTNRK